MVTVLPIFQRLCLAFTCLICVAACEEDTIELDDKYYQDGGRGTSRDRGALEIRFSGFTDGGEVDFIEVYFSAVRGIQRIGHSGSRSVYFDRIEPGNYTYNIDVFEWRQTVSGSVGVSLGIGSGGVSAGPGGALYSGTKYEHLFLDGTAEIREGQVLIVEIKI